MSDDIWPDIERTLRIEEALDELGVEATRLIGDEWFAHCPLPEHHGQDLNPSFSFNTDKLVWSCFSCGVGGKPPKLAMRILDIPYEAALDWLSQFSDYAAHDDGTYIDQIHNMLDRKEESWRVKEENVLPYYPKSRVDEWALSLQSNTELWIDGSLVLEGRDRFVSKEAAEYLRIGYDPEHVKGSHVGPALIIPVFVGDQCVGWQQRWLGDRPKWLGKYTNTSDFPRHQTLYHGSVLRALRPTIVVESPLTVARLTTAGYPSVGTFGAKVSKGQIKLLRSAEELWISGDNDDAGERATERLLSDLDDHTVCWIIPPPTHQAKADLGDCNDQQLDECLAGRVSSVLYNSNLT